MTAREDKFNIVEIEINTKCNLSCSYCPNSVSTELMDKEMSQETFKLLMEELKKFSHKGYVFYHMYGEPLLNKNLVQFVKLTKKFLPESHPMIFSNGLLLTRDKFDELVAAGVKSFIITKQEKVDNSRVQKMYDSLPENLKKIILLQDHTDLHLSTRGGAIEELSGEEKLPLSLPCLIPTNRIVVTYSGDILPCYEDYYRKHVMGNIHKNTLNEIWNFPHYKKFRESLLAKDSRRDIDICSKCNNKRWKLA